MLTGGSQAGRGGPVREAVGIDGREGGRTAPTPTFAAMGRGAIICRSGRGRSRFSSWGLCSISTTQAGRSPTAIGGRSKAAISARPSGTVTATFTNLVLRAVMRGARIKRTAIEAVGGVCRF